MPEIGKTNIQVDPRLKSPWVGKAEADNGTATVQKPGVAGKRNFGLHVTASYSAATIGLLQLFYGAVVQISVVVHNQLDMVIFLDAANGVSLNAQLDASGTGGVIGYVSLEGYTE